MPDLLDPHAAHLREHVEERAHIVAHVMFRVGHIVLPIGFIFGPSAARALFHVAF
ncbi:hypothetical protein J4558_05665 [Leptolyngbya sp. 15MV]|nr:hypothetical protein J4558_05665 [Leptolyngbya sp. 15MV]